MTKTETPDGIPEDVWTKLSHEEREWVRDQPPELGTPRERVATALLAAGERAPECCFSDVSEGVEVRFQVDGQRFRRVAAAGPLTRKALEMFARQTAADRALEEMWPTFAPGQPGPMIGDCVRVLKWSDDQTPTPCYGRVVSFEKGRTYVRADGKPGHWLALEFEVLRMAESTTEDLAEAMALILSDNLEYSAAFAAGMAYERSKLPRLVSMASAAAVDYKTGWADGLNKAANTVSEHFDGNAMVAGLVREIRGMGNWPPNEKEKREVAEMPEALEGLPARVLRSTAESLPYTAPELRHHVLEVKTGRRYGADQVPAILEYLDGYSEPDAVDGLVAAADEAEAQRSRASEFESQRDEARKLADDLREMRDKAHEDRWAAETRVGELNVKIDTARRLFDENNMSELGHLLGARGFAKDPATASAIELENLAGDLAKHPDPDAQRLARNLLHEVITEKVEHPAEASAASAIEDWVDFRMWLANRKHNTPKRCVVMPAVFRSMKVHPEARLFDVHEDRIIAMGVELVPLVCALDLEILAELAGLKARRPWSDEVGDAMENLWSSGLIERGSEIQLGGGHAIEITDLGREVLKGWAP